MSLKIKKDLSHHFTGVGMEREKTLGDGRRKKGSVEARTENNEVDAEEAARRKQSEGQRETSRLSMH